MNYLDLLLAKKTGIPTNYFASALARKSGKSLPDDYKEVLGFEFGANTYFVITGFKLQGSDTVRFSWSVNKACNVFGAYTTTSATNNYSLYMTTSQGSAYLRYDGGTYNSYISTSDFGKRFDSVITPTGSQGMPQNETWKEKDFTASVDMCIGTTSTSATSSKLDGKLFGHFVVVGRFNGIPCERVSDGVLGYYDTKSQTFFAPTVGSPTSLGYA